MSKRVLEEFCFLEIVFCDFEMKLDFFNVKEIFRSYIIFFRL